MDPSALSGAGTSRRAARTTHRRLGPRSSPAGPCSALRSCRATAPSCSTTGGGPQRQARGRLLARPDGRRCRGGTRHVLGIERPTWSGVDGGCDRPGARRASPRPPALLTLGCTACRNHPWRRELLQEWAETARRRGMRALSNAPCAGSSAPGRCADSLPRSDCSGRSPCSARRIRRGPGQRHPRRRRALARELSTHRGAHARGRRQPGHPHPAR